MAKKSKKNRRVNEGKQKIKAHDNQCNEKKTCYINQEKNPAYPKNNRIVSSLFTTLALIVSIASLCVTLQAFFLQKDNSPLFVNIHEERISYEDTYIEIPISTSQGKIRSIYCAIVVDGSPRQIKYEKLEGQSRFKIPYNILRPTSSFAVSDEKATDYEFKEFTAYDTIDFFTLITDANNNVSLNYHVLLMPPNINSDYISELIDKEGALIDWYRKEVNNESWNPVFKTISCELHNAFTIERELASINFNQEYHLFSEPAQGQNGIIIDSDPVLSVLYSPISSAAVESAINEIMSDFIM